MKPPAIPDHTLIRPIGRGAYGEVWLARNIMGTLRAVKIIWRQQFSSDRPFEREFVGIQRYDPVSRTSGGLVHVLHIGRNESDGYFFYVMELADASLDNETPATHGVDGYRPRTLRSDLKRLGHFSTTDCLRLALDVASGLGQLHRHGLVHRDVKPGNIIYVNSRAKLADIGLVTAEGEGRTFVGTEGYIPPEGPGSPAADIYALGLVLYEASTGLPPERFPDVPASWVSGEGKAVTDRLYSGMAGDHAMEFHEVILKACESQRERRYQSAEELQADLALLQSGQSLRHMRLLKRRYATLRAALLAGATALIAALAAVFFANYRARVAAENRARETELRRQSERSQARAETAERESRRQLYTALLAEARAEVRNGELGHRVHTLDAIQRASAISNTVELRREAFAALALPDLRFERELPTGLDCTLARLDPNFKRLALCRGEGPVEIRSVPDLGLLATLPASTNRVASFAQWSADGRFLAVRRIQFSSAGPVTEVWEGSSSEALDGTGEARVLPGKRLEVSSTHRVLWLPGTRAFSFHPRFARILAGADDDSAVVWDLDSGQVIERFPLGGPAQLLEYSPDGEQFAAERQVDRGQGAGGGSQWVSSVFDVHSGAESNSVAGPRFNAISWDPGGHWIALIANNEVHLFDRQTGQTRLLGRHKSEARSALFNSGYLFTGGDEQEIICWDLRSMERAFTIGLQSSQLQFRADGEQCAVASSTGVLLHSFERPTLYQELSGDLGGAVKHGVISPNGQWLAAGGRDRLGLWRLESAGGRQGTGGGQVTIVEAKSATPFFSPDGSELFAFWNDGFGRWRIIGSGGSRGQQSGSSSEALDVTGGATVLPTLTPLPVYKPGRIYSGGFIGDTLLLGIPDGAVPVPAARIATGPAEVQSVGYAWCQIAPNGRWVALRKANQHYVDIYAANPWDPLIFVQCDAFVAADRFTPGSDELAIATYASVTFLETDHWRQQRRFPVSLDDNAQLIFPPDGRAFWLVHNSRMAALHDTWTFQTLLTLPNGAIPLAVSPDGCRLVISLDGRRLQVWDFMRVRKALRELGLDWEG